MRLQNGLLLDAVRVDLLVVGVYALRVGVSRLQRGDSLVLDRIKIVESRDLLILIGKDAAQRPLGLLGGGKTDSAYPARLDNLVILCRAFRCTSGDSRGAWR